MNTICWVKKIYTPSGLVRENIIGNARAVDVGCGQRKLPGSIGMDIVSDSSADTVHDMNQTPWPFEKNSFDLVFASQVLEHTEDVLGFIGEAYRILRPGGRIVVQVPYFRSTDAFGDITHKHFFTSMSLDYVVEGSKLSDYKYVPFRFKKIGLWYGWPASSKNPLVRIFKSFIKHFPRFYDQYLSLVMPVACLTWELEAIK